MRKVFQEQIELFTPFFGTDRLDDAQRWDFVEDYFTSVNVEKQKRNTTKRKTDNGKAACVSVD
ncbi:hypothetical protein B5F34_12685 [Mediterranea sp. An20]|nr:hypothetical protein B5F34_12685 [Mediterranea sp. An20]